jgi:hypothetical protein
LKLNRTLLETITEKFLESEVIEGEVLQSYLTQVVAPKNSHSVMALENCH